VNKLLEGGGNPQQAVDELYLRCLSRKPTEEEAASLNEQLAGVAEPKAILEDVFWALLNSREFVFNH
jgi:hypothetical protein